MKDKKQRWFYTIWIILQSILYIGLLLLWWYLDRTNSNFWITLLVQIMKTASFVSGLALIFFVCRKAEKVDDPDDPSTDI